MRWVTVATEQGPRVCGVVNGKYVDVNAADPEMPSTMRGLLELGPGWHAGPGARSRAGSSATIGQRSVAGTGARSSQNHMYWIELPGSRQGERCARAG